MSGWPREVISVHCQSTIDNALQPMLIFSWELRDDENNDDDSVNIDRDKKKRPHNRKPLLRQQQQRKPLLVALHTWSATCQQTGGQTVFARWCIDQNWHFCHPDFRGPNWSRKACGSHLAIQDVLDAVSYMKHHFSVDDERIYLVGVSGGGHMALLLAGKAPHIWAGVSAWASISDLNEWWEVRKHGFKGTKKYATYIEEVVGGQPIDKDGAAWKECEIRSPLTYLPWAAGAVNLDIYAGIFDGRNGGSVPFTHSLQAFDAVVGFNSKEKRLGGHEIIHNAALNWLAVQRRGQQAVWSCSPDNVYWVEVRGEQKKSGK